MIGTALIFTCCGLLGIICQRQYSVIGSALIAHIGITYPVEYAGAASRSRIVYLDIKAQQRTRPGRNGVQGQRHFHTVAAGDYHGSGSEAGAVAAVK